MDGEVMNVGEHGCANEGSEQIAMQRVMRRC